MELFQSLTYWHWWILGVLLIILEVFSPGAFFLWLGISSGIVGLLLLAFPQMDWVYQVLLFATFSVVSIVAWQLFLRKHPTKTEQPRLNRRGEQYIDRQFTLEAPIINGQGKIRVDDTTWKVNGPDCTAGSRVRVTGVDGVVLLVEPVDA
jgi:membrane protein implicated in regulation of membrane protease activity